MIMFQLFNLDPKDGLIRLLPKAVFSFLIFKLKAGGVTNIVSFKYQIINFFITFIKF